MSVFEPLYREYPCSRNAPLSCDRPWQTAQEVPGAKFCLECGFPATLPQKAELKGSRGTYQILSFLGNRGMGRLYSGTQLNDNQPVTIKEYLLPKRCFNPEEARQRQEIFVRVAGLSPADGKNQDFRLISPKDVISEPGERCYLVTPGDLEASLTLSQYLRKGSMPPTQVREVLNQALQTLQFLHTQKLRMPSGQVRQGIAHGNISLDSILLVENHQYFYIYLCDLAAWEFLFAAPTQPATPKPEQDLVALGQVAFSLLHLPPLTYSSSQPLDLTGQKWTQSDPHLKQFLYRLSGIETPFESAQAARLALLQLAKVDQKDEAAFSPEQKKSASRLPPILLGVFALLLLIGGGLGYFLRPQVTQENWADYYKLPSTFTDVKDVPSGNFTYTGENDGAWSFILNLRPQSDRTLAELLTKPIPNINVQFGYKPVASTDLPASAPIETVRKRKASFVITSLTTSNDNDLSSKQIGYDGLLVFVASVKGEQSLPKALHGQISLEQLRQLYTGKITNWQQLGGPHLPVKLYVPTEPEAVYQFKQIVLQNDPQQIALFEAAHVIPLSTSATQQQIVAEFEQNQAGIISFGILSKTWNQCTGYPLALVDGDKPAVQALVQLNNRPIDPTIDLCDKNSHLDFKPFKQKTYPLSYPLAVVYARDNSSSQAGLKFAELLQTREGQRLLAKVGLVPLQPTPKN